MKKILITNHIVQKKQTLSFIPFFSLLTGLLCFSCLLTSLFSSGRSLFMSSVLAKSTKIMVNHDQIYDAFLLSENNRYTDELSAYGSAFYRIRCDKQIQLSVSSGCPDVFNIFWTDEQSAPVDFKRKKTSDGFFLYPVFTKTSDYYYFHMENHSTSTVAFILSYTVQNSDSTFSAKEEKKTAKIQVIPTPKKSSSKKKAKDKIVKTKDDSLSSEKKKTKKPSTTKSRRQQHSKASSYNKKAERTKKLQQPLKNRQTSENRQSSENSNPSKKWQTFYPSKSKNEDLIKRSSANSENTLSLTPHFIKIKPGEKRQISCKDQKEDTEKNISPGRFKWISTNPDVISIKNGKIIAKAEGVSIIFARHKTDLTLRSSSLVRCCP